MSLYLSRLGRFSARHRLLVMSAWLLILAVVIGVLAAGSSGPKQKATDSAGASDTPAAKTLDRLQDRFPSMRSSTTGSDNALQLVFEAPRGGRVTDPATAATITQIVADAASLRGVAAVSNPLDPKSPYVSPDGTVAVATLAYGDLHSDGQREADYAAALTFQQHAPSGVRVELGGNLVGLSAPAAGVGEGLGVVAAFLVLFLTFGSLLAAGANLLVAAFGVGIGAVGVLAYGSLFPLGDNAIILAAMLGLAVGIDYSLFILSRFRSELREGRPVEDAVARAAGTAGTAVVFAGLTVIIALVGLLVVQVRDVTEMGVGAAAAVAVAVLVALTLLPAVLRTLGRRVLPRRERAAVPHIAPTSAPHELSPIGRGARLVVRHPVVALLSGVLVLVVVALPTLSMKTAFNVPGGADPESTERSAYNLVLDRFGGVQSPLLVLAEGTDIAQRTDAIRRELIGLPGVQQVSAAQVDAAGDTALLTVIPKGSPIDDRTKDLVTTIRDDASVARVSLAVTGEAAIYIDEDAKLRTALVTYVILITLLSLVLLTVMFRSLLIPVIATLGYLLSLLASFGGSVAVFQWGWLDPLIPAPQGDPMLSLLPIILVGVLFGLAMDYQVFLTSRIQEMHAKGMTPKAAIVAGFSRSAPVLIAAGSIMTVVFAGFASSTMAVAASIAFGLVVGVVADVFVVRLVLMPALLSLFGRAAWWLPAWLDRMIPNIDIEGRALDPDGHDIPPLAPETAQQPALV